MTYPCTSCGLCCQQVGGSINRALASGVPVLVEAALNFPYKINDSGCCEMLVNNQCSVYEQRPLFCNVDKLTDHFGDQKQALIQENIAACNDAILKAGLDPSYLIA